MVSSINPPKGNQTYRKNMTSEIKDKTASKSTGKLQNNCNQNLFRTSYETFYSKNKVENEKKNLRKKIVSDSIDFYSSHNNITGKADRIKEDRTTPNSKKLFQTVYNQKTLINMYRGDLNINPNNEPHAPEILHALTTKKHFVIINIFLF